MARCSTPRTFLFVFRCKTTKHAVCACIDHSTHMSLVLQYRCVDVNPSHSTTAMYNNSSSSNGPPPHVRLTELPWLVLARVLDHLDVPTMVAFLSVSRHIREQFWYDDNFWQAQFRARFGAFTPSCFNGCWRIAFAATFARGLSYITEEAARHSLSSVCDSFDHTCCCSCSPSASRVVFLTGLSDEPCRCFVATSNSSSTTVTGKQSSLVFLVSVVLARRVSSVFVFSSFSHHLH